MRLDNNQQAFMALVRAGLWEGKTIHDSCIMGHDCFLIDWQEVYRLAQEQSVVGLVAAGLEQMDEKGQEENGRGLPSKEVRLQLVSQTLQIEQRNRAMNRFIVQLLKKMQSAEIYTLLVKGQGIAQCYERPLWRTCGDIDLLLDSDNYEKAKKLLIPLAENVETEYTYFKHVGMTLRGWVVELHGTLQSRLSKRIDNEIDKIQEEILKNNEIRVWRNEDTDVHLPGADADAIFVFTHILHHFFFEGIGLRQICDWCRLLWTYRTSLDLQLLERRIHEMGLTSEWKAFAAYGVDYLGMSAEAMPLYSNKAKWSRKAKRINSFVLKVGNFGQNQKSIINSHLPYLIRKLISFWAHLGFTLRHFFLFPLDSVIFFGQVFRTGLHAAVRGE